ncbi:hypothetical protein J6590_065855 [Homalodisca vitripennis]|nr:hypothetical protein J6590_065855 [Homalodisca vitripennis]
MGHFRLTVPYIETYQWHGLDSVLARSLMCTCDNRERNNTHSGLFGYDCRRRRTDEQVVGVRQRALSSPWRRV